MNFEIRPMDGGDLPAVLLIERQAFPEDAWSQRTFASELAQPETRYYIVAEAGGSIAGYAGLSASGDQGDILTIAVRSGLRGHGIGSALLRELITAAEARGCTEVFLDVRADNERARRLYLRTGFTDIGVRPGYYQPSGMDAIVMRLALPCRRQRQEAGRR